MAGIVQHLRECRNAAAGLPDLEMLGRISFQQVATSEAAEKISYFVIPNEVRKLSVF